MTPQAPGPVPERASIDAIVGVLAPYRHLARATIAVIAILFAAVGLLAVLSSSGPRAGWPTVVTWIVLGSTVPMTVAVAAGGFGVTWWQRPRGQAWRTWAFTLYADLGVSTVIILFQDREVGLFGTVLFAVVSLYVAFFAPLATVIGHMVITTVVIAVVAAALLDESGHDAAAVGACALVSWLACNGAVLLINRFSRQVRDSLRAEVTFAGTDALTGLLNVRGFDHEAGWLVAETRQTVHCLLIDIDHFKTVNDRFGHAAGDHVLITLAARLRNITDDRTIVARRGGEEFVVLTVDLTVDAAEFADDVRRSLHVAADQYPITVSVGVATAAAHMATRATAPALIARGMERADEALFAAKRGGRNCVRSASAVPESRAPAVGIARERDVRPPIS